MMKKFLVLFLAFILAIGALSCKKKKDTDSQSSLPQRPSWEEVKGDATEVKIYVDESNIYGAYIAGTGENAVKEAIEKKFYDEETLKQVKTVTIYKVWTKYHQWEFYKQGGNGLTCRHSLCNTIVNNSLFDFIFPLVCQKMGPKKPFSTPALIKHGWA